MYELTVFATLILFRFVLPLGLLLAIGELTRARRRPAL